MTMQNDPESEEKRLKAQKGRNIAVALLLAGMVVLFYFITISRISLAVGH
jgi:hypothetical protein